MTIPQRQAESPEVDIGSAFLVQIGMNRRRPDAGGVIQWGVNPEGSYDRHTPVLSITRHDSPRRPVLVGHACHPTSMGQIEKCSPGYPGAMREKVEASLKDCRALFVTGCGSDAKVVYQDAHPGECVFANAPAQSRAGGIKLADAVLHHLDRKEQERGQTDSPGRQERDRLILALGCSMVSGSVQSTQYGLFPVLSFGRRVSFARQKG